MRILHLLKHGVRGGGNVHVAVDLACAQAAAGHEVAFACADGSYDDLLRAHGVRTVDVARSEGVAGTARAAATILRLVALGGFDVVHAHMMSSVLLGWLPSRLSGAVLVTTVHNSFDGHSGLMRLGQVVVAVSDAERRLLLGRGFAPERLVTVLNGVDGSAREELPLDPVGEVHGPSVMTLCGLHPRKAVNDVVSAFALVHADAPGWHLNIVGWGDERQRLEAQAVEAGIGHKVHFLGSTLTPKPVLEQAEVFVLASLADPCPLTVAEARVAGCAVVGTAVGGIPELLDHGRAGQLVPPADPAALAATLRPLMVDPHLLAEWRTSAVKGSEHLTVGRMAADYQAVYDEALARRGALARFAGRVGAVLARRPRSAAGTS